MAASAPPNGPNDGLRTARVSKRSGPRGPLPDGRGTETRRTLPGNPTAFSTAAFSTARV